MLRVALWIGNPYLDQTEPPERAATTWRPPPGPAEPADPPLPPGFPSMGVPPPMSAASTGNPQPVPTRYGLTYSVPPGAGWRPSNQAVMGWTDESSGATIVGYGAVSDYGYGYCPTTEGSALATVGARGRSGIDIDTAARTDIDRAEKIFSDNKSGQKAAVTIAGPITSTISGRPAVRYTARITNIPKKSQCDPTEAGFDIIATPAYASAEVAVFMVEHHLGLPKSLSDADIDRIIESVVKTQ
ncbi:hypothetical protein [Nocardia sp. NPDC051570]|uniref:hypothetical protein n=1 Tax=Nocardia sp. NPDC051570 TaxID=3364324 RepID=UPI003793D175